MIGGFQKRTITMSVQDPPPAKLRGKSLYRFLVKEQQRWIEECTRNGRSYVGPNGQSIRQADEDELYRLLALAGILS